MVVAARPSTDSTADGPDGLGSIVSAYPDDLSTGVLIAGLGLLEVVLLVGPAFAVGVRRRRRDLALVAVAGGDAAQLRRVVLADGVVLGVLGAAVGLLVGVGAAFVGRPLVEQYVFGARFGRVPLLARRAGLARWRSRCWPGCSPRSHRRGPPRGRMSSPGSPGDVPAGSSDPLVGPRVSLVVGGAALAAFGATRTSPAVILTGLILGELGLVCCTPTLIGALARLGRVLPLAPRIALRDASRNRAAAAPGHLRRHGRRRRQRRARRLPGQRRGPRRTLLPADAAHRPRAGPPPVDPGSAPTLAQVATTARAHLGTNAVAPVRAAVCASRGTGYCYIAPALPPDADLSLAARGQPLATHRRQARADPRCRTAARTTTATTWRPRWTTGRALPLLTDADPTTTAAATAVLRAGGVVVTDPRYLHDGP